VDGGSGLMGGRTGGRGLCGGDLAGGGGLARRAVGFFFCLRHFASLLLLEAIFFASPRLLLCAMLNDLCLSHFALHCWTQCRPGKKKMHLPAMLHACCLSEDAEEICQTMPPQVKKKVWFYQVERARR
jgi:hypothetical protein